jgi:glycosyltransferase involved in cell wall biosynthesis
MAKKKSFESGLMTKLLSVVWYKVLPAQFGGQKGIAEFNDAMSEFFHVTCICSSNNQPTGNEKYLVKPVLPVSRWQVVDFRAWKKILGELKQENYSHIILEHCYYGLLGMLIRKRFNAFLIVHSHNIEYLRFREMKKYWWPLLYQLEKKTHQSAHLSLFKTEADMEFAISSFQLDPARCVLTPFGINKTTIPTSLQRQTARSFLNSTFNIPSNTRILVFMGTLDYEPNAIALKKIVNEVIPGIRKLTSAPFRVLVCGRLIEEKFANLLSLKDEDYIYAGFVPDISPYFMGADLLINPVNSGGGIKVKIIEALSYGLPVVSTVSGAKGIDETVTGSQLTLVADNDIPEFCRQIVMSWNKPIGIPETSAKNINGKKLYMKLLNG